MASRSAEDLASEEQQQPVVETTKQAGGVDGEGGLGGEGKAPVHDASSAGHTAQTKVELSKVADTLREDAKEGATIFAVNDIAGGTQLLLGYASSTTVPK